MPLRKRFISNRHFIIFEENNKNNKTSHGLNLNLAWIDVIRLGTSPVSCSHRHRYPLVCDSDTNALQLRRGSPGSNTIYGSFLFGNGMYEWTGYRTWLTTYATALKRKCLRFDEIIITGCTGSCQNDNFQCSQWLKFRQNDDIFVSVWWYMSCFGISIDCNLIKSRRTL